MSILYIHVYYIYQNKARKVKQTTKQSSTPKATCTLYTVNPERIASVIFNDFINPATLTSLYDNDFSRVLHAHAHNVAH